MASRTRIREAMPLEEFLELPDIHKLEYIDGRIEARVVPGTRHSVLTGRFAEFISRWAEPDRLGLAFPILRCTFAGLSIIPDVVFLLSEHIGVDADGELEDETLCPPDLHIEIITAGENLPRTREKLAHTTAYGCPLGWLVDPYDLTIDVYRPGQPSERMSPDGILEGEPVLPGFRLPVAQVFGWLKVPF